MTQSLFRKKAQIPAPRPFNASPQESSSRRPNILFIIISVLAVILLIAGTGVFLVAQRTGWCGSDTDCFVERANKCDPASVVLDNGGSKILLREEQCAVTYTIREYADSEPQDVKDYFSTLTMECSYEPAQFPPSYLTGLAAGIDTRCDGPLASRVRAVVTATKTSEPEAQLFPDI